MSVFVFVLIFVLVFMFVPLKILMSSDDVGASSRE